MNWLALCCLVHNCVTSLVSVVLAVGWATCAKNRRAGLRFMKKQAGKPPPTGSGGQVAFVMPVKGTHSNSEASWLSQVNRHGYRGKVECIFVVQDESDPAYRLLLQMQSDGRLPTDGVRVLVAGLTVRTSQKLHNLIYAIERISENTEYVLMLDDDMILHPGAVAQLAHELHDPGVLAASGNSCDVPGERSVVCAAACLLRLATDISVASGKANKAWGGCCMMRAADLHPALPDGVMQHWKNSGYSDDWIITQVAVRSGRRVVNPPWALFLNVVDIVSVGRFYNFMQRQLFVLDTYVQNEGEGAGGSCDTNRLESAFLVHVMILVGLSYSSALLVVPLQLGWLIYDAVREGCGDDGSGCLVTALERPDRLVLFASYLIAAPLCLLCGSVAACAQSALISYVSAESGELARRAAGWTAWRAMLGFILFNLLSPGFALQARPAIPPPPLAAPCPRRTSHRTHATRPLPKPPYP